MNRFPLNPKKIMNELRTKIFFVLQNLSQTHMLIDLIQEVKEKGYKLRICPPVDTNLVDFALYFFLRQTTIFGIINHYYN